MISVQHVVSKYKEIITNNPDIDPREALLNAYYSDTNLDFMFDFIKFDFIKSTEDFIAFRNDINYDIIVNDLTPDEKRKLAELKREIREAEARTAPTLRVKGTGKAIRGKISLRNRPLTHVTSSHVMGRSVRDKKLYVKFHKRPSKLYKYELESNDEANRAFDEMAEESPGGFVWDELRGKTPGPVYGKPGETTPGGTSSSIKPYEPVSAARVKRFIPEVPKFEEIAKNLQAYKMSVKEIPTSRGAFTIEELKRAEKLGIHQPKIDFESPEAKEAQRLIESGWKGIEDPKAIEKRFQEKKKKIEEKRERFKAARFKMRLIKKKDFIVKKELVLDGGFDDCVKSMMKQYGISDEEAKEGCIKVIGRAKGGPSKKKPKPSKPKKGLVSAKESKEKLKARRAGRTEAERLKIKMEREKARRRATQPKPKPKPKKKTVQKKLPKVIKGTGKPIKATEVKKTIQKKITEKAKPAFKVVGDEPEEEKKEVKKPTKASGKAKELSSKIAELKEKMKGLTDPQQVKGRRALVDEINNIIKELSQITGKKVFPFIPKKLGPGRKRKPGKKKQDFQEFYGMVLDLMNTVLNESLTITHDIIDLSEFKKIESDFDEYDFSTFRGPGVSEGWYTYVKNGKEIKLFKPYSNLKEVYGSLDYVPLRGTKELGSHHASMIGFIHNFEPNDATRKIDMEYVTFENVNKISDLPRDSKWQISMGFEDEIIGDIQYVKRVDHGAISLNNLEMGRCGDACYAELVPDMVEDSKSMQEWIDHCISKHGPHGDNTMKPEQCVAAGYEKFGKSRKDFNDQNLKEVDNMPLTEKQIQLIQDEAKKLTGKDGTLMIYNEDFYYHVDEDKMYRLDFDKSEFKKNEKGGKKMPKNKEGKKIKKNDEDEDDEETDFANDDISNNEEYAKEIDAIMAQGKTRVEAQEQVARERKGGKHEPYLGNVSSGVAAPEFTDKHEITPDMYNSLKAEMAEMKKDFAPLIEKRKKKLEKDFETTKETLVKKYEVCGDFVKTLDVGTAKIALDTLEKSNLIREALFYRNPIENENPSVLDMDDKKKDSMAEDFAYLKLI